MRLLRILPTGLPSLLGGALVAVTIAVLMLAAPPRPAAAGTLDKVREAGLLRCGVTSIGVGLATMDEGGRWKGFFVDMCRALAAAVAGAADRVEFVEASSENRFAILRDGTVDVVMDGATWTLQRSATYGVDFPATYLFDGQGFMALRALGVATVADLAKAPSVTVCAIEQTTTLRNLEDWMARAGLRFTVKRVRSTEGALSTFFNHHCDLYTTDRIALFAQRMAKAPNSADYAIFPEVISKEPLGPMVRNGDKEWFDVVRWVVLATVLAEEKGITSAKAGGMKDSADPEVRKLLGGTPGLGWGLGLDDEWAWRVLTQVGNYGEIFDRHLGIGSPLRMERGLNALWTKGGLMYAPPLGG